MTNINSQKGSVEVLKIFSILALVILVALISAFITIKYYKAPLVTPPIASYNSQPAPAEITQTNPNTSIEITQAPDSTSENDLTANWRTYSNDEAGFEIKYPLDWYISINSLNNDVHLSSFKRTSDEVMPNETTIEIQTFHKKSSSQDLLSFVREDFSWQEDGIGLYPSGELKVTNLNGLTAVYIEHSGGDGPDGPGYVVEKNSEEIFYILVYGQAQEELANQILSTLKSTSSKKTANWKTYETMKSALFSSEMYKIKYSPVWSYSERRISGERKAGKLETTFRDNKYGEIVTIIAGGILSDYQNKKYINKGEVSLGNLNYKFLKLEESSLGNIIYLFQTGENLLANSTQEGYEEVIVFISSFSNGPDLNEMMTTFKFGEDLELVENAKVFFINTNAPTTDKSIGCGDEAIGIDRIFPPTTTPLKAALENLLATSQETLDNGMGLYNSLAKQNWKLENVSIVGQEAIIQFSGKYIGTGICEDPRIIAQIEQTALQFSTVKKVSIFVDGISLKELMSGRGE